MAHDHEEDHECGKCGQTFDTEEDLKIHARDEHDMDVESETRPVTERRSRLDFSESAPSVTRS